MKWVLVLLLTLVLSERSFADCSAIITTFENHEVWTWLDMDSNVKKAIAANCPLEKIAQCQYRKTMTALNCAAYSGHGGAVSIYLKQYKDEVLKEQKAKVALDLAIENSGIKAIDVLLHEQYDLTPIIERVKQGQALLSILNPLLAISYLKENNSFEKYSCHISRNEMTEMYRLSENLLYNLKSENKSDSRLESFMKNLDALKNYESYAKFQENCRSKRNQKAGSVPNKSLSTK